MGARRYGGQLIVTLLITALSRVAMLPLISCGYGNRNPPPEADVGPRACGGDYSVNWNELKVFSTYVDINGYVPVVDDGGRISAYYTNVSDNTMYGTLNSLGTKLLYLIEGHPVYTEKNIGGKQLHTKDSAGSQVATVEYIENGNAIYATVYHLVKPKHKYAISRFYHRIRCDKHGGPTVDYVYNKLFTNIDRLLGRTGCEEKSKREFFTAGEEDPYRDRRELYIQDVINSAGCANTEVSKIKSVFDCTKFFEAIPEVHGRSYYDLMLSYGEFYDPDPHTYTCPHRSQVGVDNSDNRKVIWLREYYADEIHPMLLYNVVLYELDTRSKELSVKVFSHTAVPGKYGNNGFYPYKHAERLTSVKSEVTLEDCDSRLIFDAMNYIDKHYKVPIIKDGPVGIDHDKTTGEYRILDSSLEIYSAMRQQFVRVWGKVCNR